MISWKVFIHTLGIKQDGKDCEEKDGSMFGGKEIELQ